MSAYGNGTVDVVSRLLLQTDGFLVFFSGLLVVFHLLFPIQNRKRIALRQALIPFEVGDIGKKFPPSPVFPENA